MTYADDYNLRSKDVVRLNDYASAIDGLLAASAVAQATGTISTTSTSHTDITSMSHSITVASGETVHLIGLIVFSHGTANGLSELRLARGGTGLTGTVFMTAYRSNTSGNDLVNLIEMTDAPSAGTYTYTLQWKTDAGTLYSAHRRFLYWKFQTS